MSRSSQRLVELQPIPTVRRGKNTDVGINVQATLALQPDHFFHVRWWWERKGEENKQSGHYVALKEVHSSLYCNQSQSKPLL